MAIFYSEKSAKKAKKPTAYQKVQIQSLDYQGLGIAKINGKTWFIENALPSEEVEFKTLEEKRQYGRGQAVKILKKSAERRIPSCEIYGKCGGCQMQHISLELQRQAKQNALFQRLQKLQSNPIQFDPMIIGSDKGYRRRAKLSIAMQAGKAVMGFRLQNSNQIIPLEQCEVLVEPLSQLLPKLQLLIQNWQHQKKLGHIELVNADNTIALFLRHLGALSAQDSENLHQFTQAENLSLFVMCEENKIEHLAGELPYYKIQGLKLHFSIRDFIQVNKALNEKMVEKALEWLALSSQDRVLDLFCGMGNFTLPIAKTAKSVVGVEGVEPMVQQARENAATSGLKNVEFYQTNLDEPFTDKAWAKEPFDKVLLDPARNGALFCLDHLAELKPERIVYVSCNPATLVRDAEKLLQFGYRLEKVAMIDMFPHTGHLESISLFTK
ncbi:23S rRNA (uracil(1939)-C(5))-methyltransferase RlmD [Mannheimia sp. AT1]|uniref:23S rRNA (uracil(1939)-C(5))-methyltransferase RlmD n=1 Tax=Mannheimia cairinae TaxID=3025936 RepID=A0ABT5MR20_9PAST|nr:23S rRNA (uracil(1939)-C(5))-methyltransferase RlmD [Mannheimia cairinae]MDD0824447.1 23S rRNA (uracil(1939)-C(5))-methyltransferase RlmD [Mannheimia cairinae]MDD0825548.1 23S rRNA (uracil(1939)-C(5))-methyltransferase RlmD [Mannheimia cairinae]